LSSILIWCCGRKLKSFDFCFSFSYT
jgi:hypothetical protein